METDKRKRKALLREEYWKKNPEARERYLELARRRKKLGPTPLAIRLAKKQAKKDQVRINKFLWQSHVEERIALRRLEGAWFRSHPVIRQHRSTLAGREHFRKHGASPRFRITAALRVRLRKCVQRVSKKSASTFGLVGCSRDQLMAHLSRKFLRGMSMANYGEWEIDHIIPCSKFDLTNPAHQRQCFHFSNLQPLWKEDNRRKRDRILSPIQPELHLQHVA